MELAPSDPRWSKSGHMSLATVCRPWPNRPPEINNAKSADRPLTAQEHSRVTALIDESNHLKADRDLTKQIDDLNLKLTGPTSAAAGTSARAERQTCATCPSRSREQRSASTHHRCRLREIESFGP